MKKASRYSRFSKAVVETFYQYVDSSKVNGLWMLQRKSGNLPKRCMWSAVLLALVFLAIYLSIMLWDKFYSSPTIVTIETSHPASSVAFPAISLCSPQIVLEHKLQRFLSEINIPSQFTLADITSALIGLEAFTVRSWSYRNETRFKIADLILQQNNLTVYAAIRNISGNCEDFVKYCYWGAQSIPCNQKNSDLAFTPSVSNAGFCCTFNYNVGNHSHVPFSTNNFGLNKGLVVVGLDRALGNHSTGMSLKVHHPLDYATESSSLVTLHPYSETFVAIYPVELSSSKEVLNLETHKRNCLIAGELGRAHYRQAACMLGCQQEAIYRKCKCHPYNIPNFIRNKAVPDCLAKDALCFIDNFDHFKTLQCGHCLPNCYDVTYTTSSDYTGILEHNVSVSDIYSHNISKDNFIVRIFLAKQTVPSHRKVVAMSLISLLADLGGVFNLSMGISIISVVEFLYFCTFRLRRNYKSQSALIDDNKN